MPTARKRKDPPPSAPNSAPSQSSFSSVASNGPNGKRYVALLRGPGFLESVIFLNESAFGTYLLGRGASYLRDGGKKRKKVFKGEAGGKKEKKTTAQGKAKERKCGDEKEDENQAAEYALFDRIEEAEAYLLRGGTRLSSSSSSSRYSSRSWGPAAGAAAAATRREAGRSVAGAGRTPSSRSSPSPSRRASSTGGRSSTPSDGARPSCSGDGGGTPDATRSVSAGSRRSSRRTAGKSAKRLGDDPEEEAEARRRRAEEVADAAERRRMELEKIRAEVRSAPWSVMLERLALYRSEHGTFTVRDEHDIVLRRWLAQQRMGYKLIRKAVLRGEKLKRVDGVDLTGERVRTLRVLGVPGFDCKGDAAPALKKAAAAGPNILNDVDATAVTAAGGSSDARSYPDSVDETDPEPVAADLASRACKTKCVKSPDAHPAEKAEAAEADKRSGVHESFAAAEPVMRSAMECADEGDNDNDDKTKELDRRLEERLVELEASFGVGPDSDSDSEQGEDKNGEEEGGDKEVQARKWLLMYEKLRQHKETYGTLEIKSEDDPSLVSWIRDQQAAYRYAMEAAGRGRDTEGSYGRAGQFYPDADKELSAMKPRERERHKEKRALNETRTKLLQDIGFDFGWVDGVSGSWGLMLERLKAWKAEHGTFDVDIEADYHLHTWATSLHRDYKRILEGKKEMTPVMLARKEALQAVGFPFRHLSFEERLEQLSEFVKEYGHCNVPERGHVLSTWMNATRQRAARVAAGKPCRDGKLTAEQLERLRAAGFRTARDVKGVRDDAAFESMFKELVKYRDTHGDCLPNTNGGTDLGRWVTRQRQDYRALQAGKPSRMTFERMQRLLAIGFIFEAGNTKASWGDRMQQLRAYRAEHGDLLVPVGHSLRPFVGQLRMKYNRTLDGEKTRTLSKDQIRELEEMGMVFQLGKRPAKAVVIKSWEQRFEELKEFKAMYNHCVVPQHYQGHPGLGSWVNKLRTEYKHLREGGENTFRVRSLNAERVARLVDLGFVFDAMYRRGCKLGEDLVEVDRSSGLAQDRGMGTVPAPTPQQQPSPTHPGNAKLAAAYQNYLDDA